MDGDPLAGRILERETRVARRRTQAWIAKKLRNLHSYKKQLARDAQKAYAAHVDAALEVDADDEDTDTD